MALAPRDSPVTRDNVVQWWSNWKRASNNPNFTPTWENYLRAKIAGLDIEDPMIDTREMPEFSDETHLADMILADMVSYA